MSTSNSSEMFTIERHGDLTLIVATPALEALDQGLEEEAAELILNAIRDQDGALIVVCGGDGVARMYASEWFAPLSRLRALVPSRVTRDFSPAEQVDLLHEQPRAGAQ